MDPYIVLGGVAVGLLVGLTGAGGGALMTPMLILLFSVRSSTAIASDLVAAVIMRPVGAVVHWRRGTVNLRLAAWTSAGSVPAALAGSYLLHLLGRTNAAEHVVDIALGAALLLGSGAMALRYLVSRRSGRKGGGTSGMVTVKPTPTLVVGVIGGFMVGFTSVGAGSLMVVLFMFLFPALSASELVGTDLTQAIPLTAAAALGAVLFGHVAFAVTAALVIGSVPGVLVGSLLSPRVPDGLIRPAIMLAIAGSGLKYVGVGMALLWWVLAGVAVVVVAVVALAQGRGLERRHPLLGHGGTSRYGSQLKRPLIVPVVPGAPPAPPAPPGSAGGAAEEGAELHELPTASG